MVKRQCIKAFVNQTAAVLLTCLACLTCAAQERPPFFACTFDDTQELARVGMEWHRPARFVAGIEGQALDLRGGTGCKLSSIHCLPETEGTLSVWMRPHFILDQHTPYSRNIILTWKGEQAFTILGLGYGDIMVERPHKLYMLTRKSKTPRKRQASMRAEAIVRWEKDEWQHIAAVWRIRTGKRDGVLRLYVNGKRVGRLTDFFAREIEFGEHLWIVPDAAVDELKVWDWMFGDKEVAEEYRRGQ